MQKIGGTVQERTKRSTALGLSGLIVLGAALFATQSYSDSHDVTISHGYSFFGDLKYPADFKHLDYVNVNAPKGGEISQGTRGTFDSFNPYVRKGRSAALSSAPYENIMVATADDINASYCFLCTTIEYPASLDWVTFNLRDDIKFSDGSPLTAEDVKFTFELFAEQGLPSYQAIVKGWVESIEVENPYRIKFTFTDEAARREVVGVAGGIPVFSKNYFEENELRLDEAHTKPFIGTGPYILDEFEFGQRVILKRRDDYWGETHPLNIGQNNFDRIRIEYFADGAAAFEAFKGGAFTFRNENSSKSWATQYDFPAVLNGDVIKAELPDGSIGTSQSFVFNLTQEKFQDIRVREAIGLMFNFEWSNEKLFFGIYDRINSFWENTDLAATGLPTEGELAVLKPLVDQGLLDGSILTDEAVMAPVSGERQLDRKNLRRASALLDEAGWVVNESTGLREKDGEVFKVEFLESSPAFDRVINPYVSNLVALGIDAKLNRVDYAQEVERTRAYDYDIITHQMPMAYEPSSGLKQYFGSEAREGSSRNAMQFEHPAVDILIDQITEAKTKDELNTLIAALDRVLRAQRFWVPQWIKNAHTIAYYDQYDYPKPLPPYALGETSFWWFDAEKAAKLKASGALK